MDSRVSILMDSYMLALVQAYRLPSKENMCVLVAMWDGNMFLGECIDLD